MMFICFEEEGKKGWQYCEPKDDGSDSQNDDLRERVLCATPQRSILKIEYRNVHKGEHVSIGMWACCVCCYQYFFRFSSHFRFFFFFSLDKYLPGRRTQEEKNMFSSHEASLAFLFINVCGIFPSFWNSATQNFSTNTEVMRRPSGPESKTS